MERLRTALEHRLARLDALANDFRIDVRHDLLRLVVSQAEEMSQPRTWSPAERRLIRMLSGAIRIRRSQCYANAQRLLLAAAQLAVPMGHELAYGEGYARLSHFATPFAHAWCLVNGRVWDPTLEGLGVAVEYLGFMLPATFVHLTLRRRGRLGPMLAFWSAAAGAGQAGLERCLRVGSALHPRRALAGSPARV